MGRKRSKPVADHELMLPHRHQNKQREPTRPGTIIR